VGTNIKVFDGALQFPEFGLAGRRISRRGGGTFSPAVSQNPRGKYFVSVFCTDVDMPPRQKTGAAVG
jgi:hypothetical protein